MEVDEQRYVAGVIQRMEDAGLEWPELVSSGYDYEHFGNAFVQLRHGCLRFRITRDRGQEFLEIGPNDASQESFRFHDVEAALGWRPMESIWRELKADDSELESLDSMLIRVAQHLSELEKSFAPNHLDSTLERIKQAVDYRRRAVQSHFEDISRNWP